MKNTIYIIIGFNLFFGKVEFYGWILTFMHIFNVFQCHLHMKTMMDQDLPRMKISHIVSNILLNTNKISQCNEESEIELDFQRRRQRAKKRRLMPKNENLS